MINFRPILVVLAVASLPLRAQPPVSPQKLQFEVAAIKPTADRTLGGLIVHLPGESGYRGTNMPLINYLTVAYQVRFDQISGPVWLNSEYFDMEGKAERTCTADELHLMLQHLLEERFSMKLHRETRQVSGYNLVVDKGGPKMAEHDPEDREMLPIQFGGPGVQRGKNVSMQYLAFYLSGMLGETVVDQTGLAGHYDFDLKYQMDFPAPPPPPPPGSVGDRTDAAPISAVMVNQGVFDALRKQLGLRLDKAKVPATHIIIDHIEKLADN